MRDNSISVIIPTYNRSSLVKRAVESALAAVASGDEIIVIDDGSTDDTAQVLMPFYDKIRYVRIENTGAGAARNAGIRLSTRPLVTFLDSDDEWLPDKLYIQRAVMDSFENAVFCFSDLLSHHDDGKIFHHVLSIWRNDPSVGHADAKENLKDLSRRGTPFSSFASLPAGRADFNVFIGDMYTTLMEVYYVWTCSIMVRKESAGDSFIFPEDTNIFEEWECFGRLAKEGPAVYLDCELAIQNVHSGPRLTDVEDIVQATKRIHLLGRVWGSDRSFMSVHSERFRSVLDAQYLRRAKYLIRAGRTKEAKEDLDFIGGGPWSYRLMANLPSAVVANLLSIRRRIKGS